MARPLRIEFPGAFYHVYSRGNERKDIFRNPVDYELFLGILKEASQRFDFLIHAFCLMPNHFHLLLETKDANLSHAMKRLLGLYTVRFNRRHKRLGHLFQGRYKALLVEKDPYFLELSRYIHLNPVKARLVKNPEDYRWSSMRYFIKDKAPDFLEKDLTSGSFHSTGAYKTFVLEGLKEAVDPFALALGGFLLGSENFLERLKEKIAKKKQTEYRGRKHIFKKPAQEILCHLKDQDQKLSVYCLWKYARLTQREIGQRFNITHSAVSASIRRLEQRLPKDKTLQNEIHGLDRTIRLSNVED